MVMFADDVEKGKKKKKPRIWCPKTLLTRNWDTTTQKTLCKTNASSVFIKCQTLYACYWEYNFKIRYMFGHFILICQEYFYVILDTFILCVGM